MISVIIPTLNRPNLIGRSLKSVLNQTVTDLEVIVVDGSENDDTQRQIDLFGDKRIQYLKITNRSAAHSRNTGIQQATGTFVAFNDDDDVWHSHKLEKQLDCFKKAPSEKVVFSSFRKTVGKTTRITPDKIAFPNHGNIYDDILKQNFVGLPTTILPMSCCQKVMFDEHLQCLEDWDWFIRLAKKYPFYFIKEPLVTVHDSPGSANKMDYHIKAATYKKIYAKHLSDIKLVPAREAKHLLSIGNHLCLAGETHAGREYLLRSLKIDTGATKSLAAYLLSFLGPAAYRSCFKTFERLTHSEP
jgi:glycosyltransferase involved in cell wall biosynthesis